MFVQARREQWLDALELHVRGGFYAAYFGMHKRLSGEALEASLPRANAPTTAGEKARMDELMHRANEFFRAKERRDQRERNRG